MGAAWSACARDIHTRTSPLELGVAKRGTVNDGRSAREQPLRLEGGELSERFGVAPDAFREMDDDAFRGCRVDVTLEAPDVQNEGANMARRRGQVGLILGVSDERPDALRTRSEERRVGKECRSRWT